MRTPLFLLMGALALLAGFPPLARAQEIVVSPDGPVRSLREAIDRSAPGGRIVLRPGVYRDSTVVVDRPLEIVGIDGPVLDGQGKYQILTVTADSVTIRGLVFRNVGVSFIEDRAALKIEGGNRCVIEDNRFEHTFFAVYLARSSGCRIAGNVMTSESRRETQSGNGIHLWYSREVTIENNTIRGHRDGIYMEFVEDALIRNNDSAGNLRYGLHFMFSDRCRYEGNRFAHNDAGVAVMYTENVEMLGNRFEQNWGSAAFGLLLKDITDSRIAGNRFAGNTTAIYAENSNRLQVEDNAFVENGWAIKIMSSSMDNRFTRNNFIGNAFDVSTNSRNNFSTFDHNYWDRYQGYDLDRDGAGDVPFRPVRFFSLLVERNEPTLILLRSFFIDLLDVAERILPVLTPETLVDERPRLRPFPLASNGNDS